MKYINLTPHDIVMNDGVVFPASGTVARVTNQFTEFDTNRIATVTFGEVENLLEPKSDTIYIVSQMVLAAASDRNDLVAPATGHPECVRENGHIISVPGFIQGTQQIAIAVFYGGYSHEGQPIMDFIKRVNRRIIEKAKCDDIVTIDNIKFKVIRNDSKLILSIVNKEYCYYEVEILDI